MHQQSSADQRTETTQEQRESRPCRPCLGSGSVVEEVEYDPATGVLRQVIADCPACGGIGSMSVYLYGGRA